MSGDEVKVSLLTKKKKNRSRKNLKQRKNKKRKQKRNQATMPSTSVKPQTSISKEVVDFGQCFWNNYKRAMEWQHKSLQMYWKQRAHSLYWENQNLKKKLSQVSNVESQVREDYKEEYGVQDYDEEMKDYDEEMKQHDDEMMQSEVDDDDDDDEQYEVSDEFMKFIEISLRHKENLKQQRKKENKEKKDNKGNNQDETSEEEDEMLVAPKADLGEKRRDEMKELYGDESAKIHGMETAMHLGFIRKCDKNKPVMWPVMALAPTFP